MHFSSHSCRPTTHGMASSREHQAKMRKCRLPGVLRCAGLMVPDPSIMLPPMPFIEVVTGWEVVEYMATGDDTAAGSSGEEKRGRGCAPESVAAARWRAANSSGRGRAAGGGRVSLQIIRCCCVSPSCSRTGWTRLDWTWTGRATARWGVACRERREWLKRSFN